MADKKGVPKRDGSGHGTRDNANRGGCNNPPAVGKGQASPPPGRGRNRRVL